MRGVSIRARTESGDGLSPALPQLQRISRWSVVGTPQRLDDLRKGRKELPLLKEGSGKARGMSLQLVGTRGKLGTATEKRL